MRTRTRTLALALALVAVPLAGCGTEAADGAGGAGGTTTTTASGGSTTTFIENPPPVVVPSIGDLPDLVTDGPAAEVTVCRVDPDDPERVEVEAVVTNTEEGRRMLQGVPLTIRDGGGRVVTGDHEELWNSIAIGSGRQALLRETVDIDGTADDVSCEVGDPDLRDDGPTELRDVEEVEFSGCSPIQVSVTNPHDVEVGVRVLVEAFDASGYSAGTFELGQWPTNYSKPIEGRGELDRPLAGGATGTYELDPHVRINDYGTPMGDGPISSCKVTSVVIQPDPDPIEVLVD